MGSVKKALLENASARLKEIDAALAKLEEQTRKLHEERDALNLLRERYGSAPVKKAARAQLSLVPGVPGAMKKPSPSEAVLALVRSEPGLKVRDVVNRLEGQIHTRSTNERRLITSTVDVLVRRRGKLRKDADGRVYLATA